MVKKFLSAIVLMVAFIFALASCGNGNNTQTHTHNYGEWTTIKEKTCTEDGTRERICACGEKETQTLSSGHNFADWGLCFDCDYGWVNINLPETPLTVKSYSSYFEISDLRYELGKYDSGYLFRLYYSGTLKKTGSSNTYIWMNIKLMDSDGYVIFSDTITTEQLNNGDKVKNQKFDKKYLNLDSNETYTLIISDYN